MNREVLRSAAQRSVTLAALVVAFLVCLPPLGAQVVQDDDDDVPLPPPAWTLQAFATWSDHSSNALFGGASLARFWGSLGLRLGGAAHPVSADASQLNSSHIGAWVADADLMFEPLRAAPDLKAWLFGFSLYVFGGVGGYGLKTTALPETTFATLSYGMGVSHDLLGPFGLQGEARYRTPLESDAGFVSASRQRLEFSVGVRAAFGSRKRRGMDAKPSARSPRVVDAWAGAMATYMLDVAESYLNTPYLQGGTTPQGGFDAAGFVRYVIGKAQFELGQKGTELPRTARDLAKLGQPVPLRIGSVRPGDLLFFARDGRNIDHVAIYAGRDRILHATASGGGVRYDVLGDGDRGRWFADHLVAARRLAGAGAGKASEAKPDGSFDPPDPAPK